MRPGVEKLCGVPSNCSMCRHVPTQRKAVGLPEVCPRGKTAENTPAPETGGLTPQEAERRRRQVRLCVDVRAVRAWRKCCGGRRPTKILCGRIGALPWTACLRCGDYQAGPEPATRPIPGEPAAEGASVSPPADVHVA